MGSNKDNLVDFIGAVFLLLIAILGVIVRGFVLSVFWGWFIVPVFNTGTITTAEAFGIVLVVDVISTLNRPYREEENGLSWGETIFIKLFTTLTFPLLILLFGWIVKLLLGWTIGLFM